MAIRSNEEAHELAALVDVLKGVLAAQDMEIIDAPAEWMMRLHPQERALVGALFAAHPKLVNQCSLLDALPCRDHVVERSIRLVDVIVCKTRKKLGADSIENIRGLGYRLGDGFRERIASAS